MYKAKLNFFGFDLSLIKIEFSIKKPRTHDQRQTHYFEFDVSLTKSKFSAKNNLKTHVQNKLIFLSLT